MWKYLSPGYAPFLPRNTDIKKAGKISTYQRVPHSAIPLLLASETQAPHPARPSSNYSQVGAPRKNNSPGSGPFPEHASSTLLPPGLSECCYFCLECPLPCGKVLYPSPPALMSSTVKPQQLLLPTPIPSPSTYSAVLMHLPFLLAEIPLS